MIAIVTSYIYALQFASPELSKNSEIVSQALNTTPSALGLAPLKIQNNFNIAKDLIQKDSIIILYVGPKLKNNMDLWIEAAKKDGPILRRASQELQIKIAVSRTQNNTCIIL